MTPTELNTLIRSRRSVFPKFYNKQPISREIIESILENANWAPTHKKTEPWRFKVFTGDSLQSLSNYLGDWYERNTPKEKYSQMKLKKTRKKPLQSAAVIALCMQRDPEEGLPEWEEIAALACAVQNMWLSCTAHKIGSYWSSPRSIIEAREFLNLKEGEKCFGLFYMGYYDDPGLQSERSPVQEKTEWM